MAARRRDVGILVFCIVLAALLWGYVTLTRTYEDYISVPFGVITPSSAALLSTVPDRVTVRVRGTGWQLLNMRLISNTTTNTLDLSLLKPTDQMTYIVSKTDLLRSIVATPGTQVLDITPGSMTLATGEVTVRRVPVRLRSSIMCREGFMAVGEPRVQPMTVELRGSAAMIDKITSWPTDLLVLEDQHDGGEFSIALSDSMSTLMSVTPTSVRVVTDVQQSADVVVDGVPVEYAGNNRRNDLRIRPSRLSVIVKGGIADLSRLTSRHFRAIIDDSTSLATGLARPRIEAPSTVIVIGTIPSIVQITSDIR